MDIEIRLMGLPVESRKCGCIRQALPDWKHWWRYTRLRLVFRAARGWTAFWAIKWQVVSHCWAGKVVREHILPVEVGLGLIDPAEGLDGVMEAEGIEGRWKAWGRERTLLGASSEHPEGIYAEKGSDLVCMTEDEYRHWYGGRGDSRGGQKGA